MASPADQRYWINRITILHSLPNAKTGSLKRHLAWSRLENIPRRHVQFVDKQLPTSQSSHLRAIPDFLERSMNKVFNYLVGFLPSWPFIPPPQNNSVRR